MFLEGSQEFRFFSDFTGIFRRNSCGQEFLYLIRILLESGRIPVPANCCLARPATKEVSLLNKIWTKMLTAMKTTTDTTTTTAAEAKEAAMATVSAAEMSNGAGGGDSRQQ